jgi:hypothetical protein
MAEHFTGEVRNGVVVFDPDVPPPGEGARVRVEVVDEVDPSFHGPPRASTPLLDLIDQLDRMPGDPGWPGDAAAQHDHYLYGSPKRP